MAELSHNQQQNEEQAKPTEYTEQELCLSKEHFSESTGSIGGGFSHLHAREKFVGTFNAETIPELLRSYLTYSKQVGEHFRACARVYATREDLLQLPSQLEAYKAAFQEELELDTLPLSLEYYYLVGGASEELFVVGLGINGVERYAPSHYHGHKEDEEGKRGPKRISSYEDLLALQSEAQRKGITVEGQYDVRKSFQELTVEQQQAVHQLLSENFGEQWTLHAVQEHESTLVPTCVLIDKTTQEVAAVALAEPDAHTVEVTEWAANRKGAGAVVMRELVRQLLEDPVYSSKTIYGEFNLTSPAARQAMKLGFSVPPLLPGVPASQIIPGNVKVGNKLTDFGVLVLTTH